MSFRFPPRLAGDIFSKTYLRMSDGQVSIQRANRPLTFGDTLANRAVGKELNDAQLTMGHRMI